jgi:choline dehydrogenase-like flavoprotein
MLYYTIHIYAYIYICLCLCIYRSVPQRKSHLAANNQVSNQPRGRVLGGSSSTNSMLYVRPAKEDFNRWEEKYGCTGWGYDDMLPIMKRIEDADVSIASHPLRNRGGTMGVQLSYDVNKNTDWFIESAQKHGYQYNADYNADTREGVSYAQYSQKRGRRWSTVQGYLLYVKVSSTHLISSHPISHFASPPILSQTSTQMLTLKLPCSICIVCV